ncbi:glycogen debranching N-terminal domain-containing protein, partial [Sinomonas sp.]|uniref:glycogen debranching N-terminal domain-containing protein n=1 Tax=Sinomonas sp. TaxID=1914986 RepID=UPI002FE1CD4B
MPEKLQPFLHDLEIVLRAPTQAWSDRDGQIRAAAPGGATVQGVMHSDVRVLSEAVLEVGGQEPEPAGSWHDDDGRLVVVGLPRNLAVAWGDPVARIRRARRVDPGVMEEEVEFACATEEPVSAEVTVRLAADLAPMEAVKSGIPTQPLAASEAGGV